jgi:hypothetical protein
MGRQSRRSINRHDFAISAASLTGGSSSAVVKGASEAQAGVELSLAIADTAMLGRARILY